MFFSFNVNNSPLHYNKKTALKRLFDYTSLHFIFLNPRKNKKRQPLFQQLSLLIF